MKIFKSDMEEINSSPKTKKIPAYKRILVEEYWKIPDDTFDEVIDEILDNVKKGELELIDIVKLFEYFIYFSKSKIINQSVGTLEPLFLNGMNLSSLHSHYCNNVDEELGKVVLRGENTDTHLEMENILKHFNILNEQLLEKEYKEKADQIFKYIPMKMADFYERFDKECMNIPILKYYDPYQVFQRVSCASNEDIVLIKEKIIKRAEENEEITNEEISNLRKLKQIIDEYIDGKEITIKIVLLKEFAAELGELTQKFLA